MHRVVTQTSKFHVMIMRNVFASRKAIHAKFDLKGSTVGRAATVAEKRQRCPVLKDLDFAETHLHLVRACFLSVERDARSLSAAPSLAPAFSRWSSPLPDPPNLTPALCRANEASSLPRSLRRTPAFCRSCRLWTIRS
jgi:hypothetical protein